MRRVIVKISVNSILGLLLLSTIGLTVYQSYTYGMRHYVNPHHAFVDGCVISRPDQRSLNLCAFTSSVLNVSNLATHGSLWREGTYPIYLHFASNISSVYDGAVGVSYIMLTRCDIYIEYNTNWEQNALAAVIIHEISHCYGIKHSKDPKSIMYYEEQDGPYSADQFRDAWVEIEKQAK